MFTFKKDRLKEDKPLGEGSFGQVFPYQKNEGDMEWVVKRIETRKIEDVLSCISEIVLGFACDHPCLVLTKGYAIQTKDRKHSIYLKLPRMNGGNLADELQRRKEAEKYLSESELVKHFYRLLCGVEYLHHKKIFHGDIKINNILLDDKGNVMLSDIGSAKYIPEEDSYNRATHPRGAENYKAPEIIQHERDYKSDDEDEKENDSKKNILRKDDLFLADSWSLGLAILEMCLLKPTKVNPRDPIPLIIEDLQKKRREAKKRYKETLIDIIFDLLKIDPKERLKVSAVKKKLEENCKEILTEEFKKNLGIQKQNKSEASSIAGYFEAFNEKTNTILKRFEDEKKAKEFKLNCFQESINKLEERLNVLHIEIHNIKYQKSQEAKEVSRKYENIIQDRKQENLKELEKIPKENFSTNFCQEVEQPSLPQNLEVHQASLTKVSAKLNRKWSQQFEIKGEKFLSFSQRYGATIDDKLLADFIQDMVQECLKENLWEGLNQLEIKFKWANSITDESLKVLALELGPQLSNVQHLVLDMSSWRNIKDEGLEEFARQLNISKIKHLELDMTKWELVTNKSVKELAHGLGSHLANIEHLSLKMKGWDKITDDGLTEIACQIGPKLSNIKHLHLDIYRWSQITDEGLRQLACQIGPKLANIQYLHLDMSCWARITDEGLESFSSQLLTQLSNIQHLMLSLSSWTKITEKGFKFFASHFGAKLKNIESLNLNFYELEITSASLDFLATHICNNLLKLQQLRLNLLNCEFITESDKENLREKFKNIPHLKIN